jgi:hypothetical protein
MTEVKKQGEAISIWIPSGEPMNLARIAQKANKAQENGPELSLSYIVRTLLKAYEGGLAVPGLPRIGMSETTDTQRGAHGPIRQDVRRHH